MGRPLDTISFNFPLLASEINMKIDSEKKTGQYWRRHRDGRREREREIEIEGAGTHTSDGIH